MNAPFGIIRASAIALPWVWLMAAPAAAQTPHGADEQSVYAIGAKLGKSLKPFHLTPAEEAVVKRGLNEGLTGADAGYDPEEYAPLVAQLLHDRTQAMNTAFLEKARKTKGAVETESGVIYVPDRAGKGASPRPWDQVTIRFQGLLTDGTVFESNSGEKVPKVLPLQGLIPCLAEGIQRMKVGEKAKLVCPSALAYGKEGRPPKVPAEAVVAYEVELLDVKPGLAPAAP